jgi:sec-independent protein translocase protein TatB
MFDIGWGELLLIGIVALIAIGPKELPTVLRTVGQWTAKLRRMASDFQNQFQEAMREAELADLKKEVDALTTQAQTYTSFDPVSEVRKEFEATQRQVESAMDSGTSVETSTTASPSKATAPGAGAASSEPTAPVTPPAEPETAPVEPGTPAAGGKPA